MFELDIVHIQAIFHAIIGTLYIGVVSFLYGVLRLSPIASVLFVITGFLIAIYRFATAIFVWSMDRVESGFSGTFAAVGINSLILAFATAFLFVLLAERHRDD